MSEINVRKVAPLHLTWALGLTLTYATLFQQGAALPDSAVSWGWDSHAYWAAWQGDWRHDMYDIAPGRADAFNYSPAFALLIWPLAQLPWLAFGIVWALACTAGLIWLFRPLGGRWIPPLLLCCTPEIVSGNIFWMLAVFAVLATCPGRPWRGGAWAMVVLTKATPALGPIWYVLRGDWQRLGASVITTLVVVGASFAIVPDLWHQWLDFLLSHEASKRSVGAPLFPPLIYRLPIALVVVVWGALTNRPWTIAVAMVLATPVTGIAAFTMLAAIPRLQGMSHSPTLPDDPAGQLTPS